MNQKEELIICRCERVKFGLIRAAINRSGAQSVNQVKKLTRAGMGLCQGRTCAKAVESILAAEGQASHGSEPYQARPPVRGVAVAALASGADQYDEPSGPVKVRATSTQDSENSNEPIEK